MIFMLGGLWAALFYSNVGGGPLDAPAVQCFVLMGVRRIRNISVWGVEGAAPYMDILRIENMRNVLHF